MSGRCGSLTPVTIRLIWAQDRNRVIGVGNGLPWRVPEDSRRFQALTMGAAVVMGRRTWDSLPDAYQPLPGRENWVLTRNAEWTAQGAIRASSLDEVIGRITGPDLWVAGGGVVYSLALPLAQECFVTEIDAEFPGDSWAPELRFPWRRNESHHAASGWQVSGTNGVRFRYSVFVRDGS